MTSSVSTQWQRRRPRSSRNWIARPPNCTGKITSGRGELPRIAVAQPGVRVLDLRRRSRSPGRRCRTRSGCRSRSRAPTASPSSRGCRPPGGRARRCRARRPARRPAVRRARPRGRPAPPRNSSSQPDVQQAVRQQPAGEELHRQVVDPLGVALLVSAHRLHPPLDQAVADGERRRVEPVARRGRGRVLADRVDEPIGDRFPQGCAVAAERFTFERRGGGGGHACPCVQGRARWHADPDASRRIQPASALLSAHRRRKDNDRIRTCLTSDARCCRTGCWNRQART